MFQATINSREAIAANGR
ncbi:hypothetical protein YPPY96_2307, partial [Yersinia pestis PY-96]